MTGEITLRGRVLPIGGLKEKVIAAHRGGIKKVVIPKENEKDYKELPAQLKRGLSFSLVNTMDEVVKIALPGLKSPRKGKAKKEKSKIQKPKSKTRKTKSNT